MDKHQNYNTQGTTLEKHSKGLNQKNKVDINVLLNRVRTDKKKEKLESLLFFGFISLAVIVTGIIVSL
tara:strand:- start:874 stop:1077 length:204 start_codon:yes stop_codon:yes gene_type:complete